MAEQPQAAPAPEAERPYLATALDQLTELTQTLNTTATHYREMLSLLEDPNPDVRWQMLLPSGRAVAVPAGDTPTVKARLEDAVNELGMQIVRLWGQASQICTGAVAYCQQAAKAVETPPAE